MMLRCRKCRKVVANSTCLLSEAEEAAVCSIHHLDLDCVPDWIYSSIEQAQWTMGKLNCPTCSARLGGFNFVQHSPCPCGTDASVHLSKSRVDQEVPHSAVIIRPRTTRAEGSSRSEGAGGEDINSGLLQSYTGSLSHSPDVTSSVDSTSLTLADEHLVVDEDHVTSDLLMTESVDVTEVLRPHSSATSTQPLQELIGLSVMCVPPSHVPRQLNRKERNRLKSVRRKERRRERWMLTQQELEQEDVSECEESREALTCAVCLDVYCRPLTCEPCLHVFCEPCLRTLAKNQSSSTVCPLCRTVICYTSPHTELNQSVKTLFPKVYSARKLNFQNAPCSKWPLPRSNRRFHTFWGRQRSSGLSSAHRRWAPSLFSMETLHLTNMADRGSWLSDISLVIVYFHSVNWILLALLFSLFFYYLLC